MKNPFDWHHSLLYADKSREEYTMEKKGTLDHLLYQMYMVAHDCDGLFMSNSVKALNTAYYLAVGLYNIQHVEEENQMNGLVAKKAQEVLGEEHGGDTCRVSHADMFLVSLMALAILKLQHKKPAGLDVFLDKFQRQICWHDDDFAYDDGEIWNQCRFLLEFPKMLEQMRNMKFDSDLKPNAVLPLLIPDKVWSNQVLSLCQQDIEHLLTHYRTKEDQHAFVNILKGKMQVPPPLNGKSDVDDLPF